MVGAKLNQLKTFKDYLAYDDGTDNCYELTHGELIEVPPESYDNMYRARKLDQALQAIVGMRRVCLHGLALATYGQPQNRYPDLTVLRPEHPDQMKAIGKTAITLDMPPPILVVEVVSPGAANRQRDYVAKRAQYEERGILEYWIIDPVEAQVSVLALGKEGYQENIFSENEAVVSFAFPEWTLTAAEMLAI